MPGLDRELKWIVGMAGGVLLFAISAQAIDTVPQPMAARVLTNIYEIWTAPRQERDQPHRIHTEVVIYYFDAQWNNAWGECLGETAYLPLADCPTVLKVGQRVSIDGVIVPMRERFLWDKTQIRVLEENVHLKAEDLRDLGNDPKKHKGHLVVVQGLADRVLDDPTHITVRFLSGTVVANAFLLKDPDQPAPQLHAGDLIRIKCVYSPQFDLNGEVSDLSLFIGRPSDIQIIGSLSKDSRFDSTPVPVGQIQEDTPTNRLVHVTGVVRAHEQGKSVTLWDPSGQILVESRQTQPLRFGDHIEAVGYPLVVGLQQCLKGSLYRFSVLTNPLVAMTNGKPVLTLTETVRDLSREEASRHSRVSLRAIVTWSHALTPFAYLEDASGGIRVMNPSWQEKDTSKPGTLVTVEGEVCEGDFVPAITNAVISRVGWRNLDQAPRVTLEEALTGVHDGRWVEMRGFVRQVTSRNGLVKFDLTTSRGEFEAWTPATQSFDSWQGSILRLQGVCAAIANPRHQLIGIQIWVPEVKYLQVEEAPPDDLFAVPMRPLDSLRRFNSQNALNQRVRTEGTVVLQIPGQCLYVQDGEDGIIALSQSKELVYPGDRVEVVGFPGNEGRRFLLREALYRRISTGKEPSPIQVSDARSVNLDFEGLLGKGEGVLLNIMNKESETRLLIRSRESVFEASLISNTAETEKKLAHVQLGSRLAVTGVYQAQSDEYGNARSFLLQLRSWDDLRVLAKPPWWTLARLLWLLVAVLAVSLFVLFWGIVLSRKNALLRDAQSELQLAHDKLEIRVQERTRELQERTDELQEQVTAKEKAREQLAEAQRSLLLASRQAGMAEVATGVLHNVGNVLNSVNISATIVNSKITQSCSVNLNKVLVLLRDHQNDIAGFFAEDPKGRKLIEYLEALNQHMAAEKTQVLQELSTLTQNVEHIKEIVSMQQSYAQVSGVLEILDPTELLEDGIRMHSAAYVRHAVKVIREYSKVPRINVDRHKALQVLTNLLHNAKYACEDKGAGDRTIRVRLGLSAPDRIRIEVEDNGVGIAPENLTRIFAFGFTTRRNGHGFGLHSGALAAREMGGSLQASSQGVGHGATFTLELPVKTQSAQPGLIADSPPNPSHQLASPCAH